MKLSVGENVNKFYQSMKKRGFIYYLYFIIQLNYRAIFDATLSWLHIGEQFDSLFDAQQYVFSRWGCNFCCLQTPRGCNFCCLPLECFDKKCQISKNKGDGGLKFLQKEIGGIQICVEIFKKKFLIASLGVLSYILNKKN